ncbi:DNA polymerase/3'-5' exonuclease PolX [Laceyella putida]|uniref:DNA-directed DNA polymerase n=1 Tax=Laceyella putida TaxID=110101 RepID=A0ABW2RP94_9BACL
MNNKQIAGVLNQLADLMEISGENGFKVNAYRRAARTAENHRTPLREMLNRLVELPGIGKGTAGVIEEIVTTGTTSLLEELRQTLPPALPDLLHLPGMGPRSIYLLYKELNVVDLPTLQAAAEQGKIRSLSGFGPKKEQKILEAIQHVKNRPDRHLLHEALIVAERLSAHLQGMEEVQRMELAGSLRRQKETIKDIDFVIATVAPRQLGERIVSLPEVREIVGQGETKVSVRVAVGEVEMGVDFRLVTPEQFASALHHFTGSTEHNIRIRQRAKELGWKVSEYGILDGETGEVTTFADEAQFFRQLGLSYVPPELREDRGEMERARVGELPRLISDADIRADLHMHTEFSDGADSIYDMAIAAKAKGYEYIAITDHSQSLKVANGLTVDELIAQWQEIEQVNREITDITILKGAEVDILPDGKLDYPDEILAQLDLVIAAVHTSMKQDEQTMTRRIIAAMENPHVHMLAHPTGRLLLRREAYALDIDAIFKTAQATGTIIELNANPHRLDLSDVLLQKAKEEYGLTFAINTDAHSVHGQDVMRYGVATARRGWLEAKDVVNTYPLAELKKRLIK